MRHFLLYGGRTSIVLKGEIFNEENSVTLFTLKNIKKFIFYYNHESVTAKTYYYLIMVHKKKNYLQNQILNTDLFLPLA